MRHRLMRTFARIPIVVVGATLISATAPIDMRLPRAAEVHLYDKKGFSAAQKTKLRQIYEFTRESLAREKVSRPLALRVLAGFTADPRSLDITFSNHSTNVSIGEQLCDQSKIAKIERLSERKFHSKTTKHAPFSDYIIEGRIPLAEDFIGATTSHQPLFRDFAPACIPYEAYTIVRPLTWRSKVRIESSGNADIDHAVAQAIQILHSAVPNLPLDPSQFPSPAGDANLFISDSLPLEAVRICLETHDCAQISVLDPSKNVNVSKDVRGLLPNLYVPDPYAEDPVFAPILRVARTDGRIDAAICGIGNMIVQPITFFEDAKKRRESIKVTPDTVDSIVICLSLSFGAKMPHKLDTRRPIQEYSKQLSALLLEDLNKLYHQGS